MSDVRNLRHLNTLSIAHYVIGGLAVLVNVGLFVYVVLGPILVSALAIGQPEGVISVNVLMLTVTAIMITVRLVLAGLVLFAGRNLGQRRAYTLCLVTAVVELLVLPPFGTALGICTLIVLMREGVKEQFESPAPDGIVIA